MRYVELSHLHGEKIGSIIRVLEFVGAVVIRWDDVRPKGFFICLLKVRENAVPFIFG